MTEAIDVFYSYSMRGQFQVIKKTSLEYSEHSVVMRKPTENVTLSDFESNKPQTQSTVFIHMQHTFTHSQFVAGVTNVGFIPAVFCVAPCPELCQPHWPGETELWC